MYYPTVCILCTISPALSCYFHTTGWQISPFVVQNVHLAQQRSSQWVRQEEATHVTPSSSHKVTLCPSAQGPAHFA